VRGPLTAVRGTYAFQGRRFDVLRDGEIRFTGGDEVNPSLSLTAARTISGVDARVRIQGTLRQPTLTLTSTPPLDTADILSLIVFNQPVNQLASEQQQMLGLRAAALASGFVTTPLVESLGRALGLQLLTVEPLSNETGGVRLTVGQQFGDRLFATYSREFGYAGFNDLLLEYEISRAFRLRATFSDAPAVVRFQGLFRRLERSGVDLIFFFSY